MTYKLDLWCRTSGKRVKCRILCGNVREKILSFSLSIDMLECSYCMLGWCNWVELYVTVKVLYAALMMPYVVHVGTWKHASRVALNN